MSSLKGVILLVVVTLVFAVGSFAIQLKERPNHKEVQKGEQIVAAEGSIAPDFELSDFNGNRTSLSRWQGKVVLVDFWATWCTYCIEEMPQLQKIAKDYGRDLVVLGIHRTETESLEVAKSFVVEKGLTYTMLIDSDGEIFKKYDMGHNLMPVAAIVGKDGKVFKLLYGVKDMGEVKNLIDIAKAG